MNFLILSVTAGEGHNATAKALKAALEERGADCTVLDTFDYISPELAKLIADGYLLVTEKAKGAYRLGYRFAEKHSASPLSERGVKLMNLMLSDDLASFINTETYDVVIYTHPFAGTLLDVMKERGFIRNRTVGILTDFTFHPYWEDCLRSESVIVPDRLLLPQALRKGFRDAQILPYGIPISPAFASRLPVSEARLRCGLDANLPVYLFMGGSMGYGRLAEHVRRVDLLDSDRDFQLAVVCGRNDALRLELERLASESRHRMTVYGFVDFIPALMDASDCILTKPGGLTSSEALAKGLPMLLVDPIPGQEERNAEFLLNAGCAMSVTGTSPADECIFRLLTSSVRLETMRACASEIGKPRSTSDAADYLLHLAHEPRIGVYLGGCSDFAEHPLFVDEEGYLVR